ncbi:hypothetical protein V498_06268 [Pseudogymnoascus sp. VKM F-4517 (FW-2822)]|nr:hypothetical protein V498_06268 [Pseudogymnoascus sp. VKM F-4517 (FW-2822)]
MVRRDDDAEVEDELVARVLLVVDAHGEAEDAVVAAGVAAGDVAVAEGLARDHEVGYGVEVEELRVLIAFFGDDDAGGFLVDDFDSWHVLSLLAAIVSLKAKPISWEAADDDHDQPREDKIAIASYLTKIVSNPLTWLTEDEQVEVWEQASIRLSERSGRNGKPASTLPIPSTYNLYNKTRNISIT